jgi:hypothetical protein
MPTTSMLKKGLFAATAAATLLLALPSQAGQPYCPNPYGYRHDHRHDYRHDGWGRPLPVQHRHHHDDRHDYRDDRRDDRRWGRRDDRRDDRWRHYDEDRYDRRYWR